MEGVWSVQGWEEINGKELQVCAACNLPWLDTSFQLAPEADLDSGQTWQSNPTFQQFCA